MIIRHYNGDNPDRVLMHADDVNIGTYLIYANTNNEACYDESGLRPLDPVTLEDLYAKGVLISSGNNFYTPTAMSKSGSVVTLSFVTYNGGLTHSTVSSKTPPSLTALSIGGKTLTPSFSSGTKP